MDIFFLMTEPVKQSITKRIQELAEKFKEKNKYIVCRQLLGLEGNDSSYVPSERTGEYYKKSVRALNW